MGYALAIHGGAGTILRHLMTPEKEDAYLKGLETALSAGESILEKGGSAMDAVEVAVMALEDNPLFNAGKGSVFNAQGGHEMDAAIMNGINREQGAVAAIEGVKNPIALARMVMEKSDHVLLCAQGAEDFARLHDCRFEAPEYFKDNYRFKQWESVKGTDKTMLDHSDAVTKKFGTVGAVAMDNEGHLAAATSTGGMTNKRFMRIGDSPINGAGNFADDRTCAISCTGNGEAFLRASAAYDVHAMMEWKGFSLREATEKLIHERVLKYKGEGGLIAVDASGNIEMPFNSEGMYRAACDSKGRHEVKIYR